MASNDDALDSEAELMKFAGVWVGEVGGCFVSSPPSFLGGETCWCFVSQKEHQQHSDFYSLTVIYSAGLEIG